MSNPNNFLDEVLGRTKVEDEKSASAEVAVLSNEPQKYRPYLVRALPQMGFAVVEADGTMHGFMYHTLRHPKFEMQDDSSYLSFTADGVAVVMQSSGDLRVIFRALLRHTLAELRAYDGKPIEDDATLRITRLEVQDAHDRLVGGGPARLVK